MSDEPQGEAAAPEAAPVETPAVEPEVSFEPQVVVDTAGYDMAIEAAEDLRQYVGESELPALDARISKLQADKAKAQSSGDSEELARYRRQAEDAAIAKMLQDTGVRPESIQGNTQAERLQNAKIVLEAVAPLKQKLEELAAPGKTGEPTPEQIAAHGTPLVPSGEPIGDDVQKEFNEAVTGGNLQKTTELLT